MANRKRKNRRKRPPVEPSLWSDEEVLASALTFHETGSHNLPEREPPKVQKRKPRKRTTQGFAECSECPWVRDARLGRPDVPIFVKLLAAVIDFPDPESVFAPRRETP